MEAVAFVIREISNYEFKLKKESNILIIKTEYIVLSFDFGAIVPKWFCNTFLQTNKCQALRLEN